MSLEENTDHISSIGLRDYYAAAVLSSIFARESLKVQDYNNKVTIADFAFNMADIMLERRAVKNYKNIEEALADKKGNK
jgi:hypothetical protein